MSNNIIIGCSSTKLTQQERDLFRYLQPWGIILFARNIEDPQQVIDLIADVKNTLGRTDIMVLIDQEGGRVSRLPAAHWRIPPSPTVFARLYEKNPEAGQKACFLNAVLTGLELKTLGINVNCAPMLDIPQHNAASIISERALGCTTQQVIALGQQISSGLKRASVAPVIKHMPGHGRAKSDSHLELPTVDASLEILKQQDFVPFVAMNNESMAMTAHIMFTQIDANLPATISPTVVKQVMRGAIGYKGLIMTDDINMQALSGSVAERAAMAVDAGCDVILHCSGKYEEMVSLVDVVKPLTGESLVRAEAAELIAFAAIPDIEQADIKAELDDLMRDFAV